MIKLIIFMMISFGISNVIAKEYITRPFRNLFKKVPFIYKLITCPSCTSVWVGAILSLFLTPFTGPVYITIIGGAMIAYTTTKLISIWLSKNEFTIED